MATRRPRVKPTANLSFKRPAKTDSKSILETEVKESISQEKSDEIESQEIVQSAPEPNQIPVNETVESTNEKGSGSLTKRRKFLKPTVNIVERKSKISNIDRKEEVLKKPEKSADHEENIKPGKGLAEKCKTVEPLKLTAIKNESEGNDNLFKSPLHSPSIKQLQLTAKNINMPEMISKPVVPVLEGISSMDKNDFLITPTDTLKCPLSPTKARQRIRPTPFFGHRRNSIQGNDSEDEPRRQRNHSISSNHSSQNLSFNPKMQINSFSGYSRHRTESTCSNLSDNSLIRDIGSKPRRALKSEEYQRLTEAKREFSHRFNGKVPDKSRLTMYDMIYYNPTTNPMKSPATKEKEKEARERRMSTCSVVTNVSIKSERPATPASVKSETKEETVMPVPQLKLGPNGEIMLDEKSLVIETTGDKEARETLANSNIVYDDEFNCNHGFYKRQKRTRDWPAEETIKFYKCLHTIGTDFSLMLTLFPNRTRRDLKLKFKKEEKHNLALVNKALLYPKTFNINILKEEFEKEEAEANKRKEIIEKMKQTRFEERKNTISKLKLKMPTRTISKTYRVLSDGDLIYRHENIKLNRSKRSYKKNAEANKKLELLTADNLNISAELPPELHEDVNLINLTQPINNNILAEKLPKSEKISSKEQNCRDVEEFIEPINDENFTIVQIVDNKESKNNETGNIAIVNEKSCLLMDEIIRRNDDYNAQDIMNMEVIFDNEMMSGEMKNDKNAIIIFEEHNNENKCDESNISADNESPPNDNVTQASTSNKNKLLEVLQLDQIVPVEDIKLEPSKELQIGNNVVNEIRDEKVIADSQTSENKRRFKKRFKPQIIATKGKKNKPNEQNKSQKIIEENKLQAIVEPEVSSKEIEIQTLVKTTDQKKLLIEDELPNEELKSAENNLLCDIDLSSLVFVESQDPANPKKILQEIYTMVPDTNQISDSPLDLPQDLIESIFAAHSAMMSES